MSTVVQLFGAQKDVYQGDSGDEHQSRETARRSQAQPMLCDSKLAYANLQAAQFDLEKAIASLVKESDGGSRTIPHFRAVLATLEACIPKIQP